MKLFEFSPTRSIRVRWTLQELEVDFEAATVNLLAGEHRQPAFLAINPAGKIPALVDGDLVLTESVAIAVYLADKYPDKKLVPADLEQRAQLNRWLLFTATELEQPLWRITRHTRLYPEGKRPAGRRGARPRGVHGDGGRARRAHARAPVRSRKYGDGRRFRARLHARLG